MDEEWHYQIRVYLSDELADTARNDPDHAALRALIDVLRRHDAALVSQFDAFAAYVAEAERDGTEKFPLYKWTKATLEDPAKRARHIRSFALRVSGNEVYGKAAADALEAELQPLVGGAIVTRMSRHDTNPANNLPVPAEFRG
jgi:hypothetical protein